jgi:hypothetical protein
MDAVDHADREYSDVMLLSSILQMLNLYAAQPKAGQKKTETIEFKIDQLSEEKSGPKKLELEAAAAGLLKPLSMMPDIKMPPPVRPSLEELIRAISKFEETEEIRVVDVFE